MNASGFPWPHWLFYSILGAASAGSLVVIFNPFRTARAEYGGARWAKESDIKQFGLRGDSGLILGIHGGKFLRMNEPLSVLCFAPPGTGKTSALVVPSLLATANSVVVHDPKGELYVLTSKHRAGFSRVVRFAPAEANSAGWNPLAKDELPEVGRGCGINALLIAQSFEQLRENFGDTGAHALKGTTSYHILFTQNDVRQAEEYSRAVGNFTRKRHSRSGVGRSLGSESHSVSFEGAPLVRPQKILSLPKEQILVIVQGAFQTPIRAKAASWFKDGNMKRAVNV